jgi:hypothetical protein
MLIVVGCQHVCGFEITSSAATKPNGHTDILLKRLKINGSKNSLYRRPSRKNVYVRPGRVEIKQLRGIASKSKLRTPKTWQ